MRYALRLITAVIVDTLQILPQCFFGLLNYLDNNGVPIFYFTTKRILAEKEEEEE